MKLSNQRGIPVINNKYNELKNNNNSIKNNLNSNLFIDSTQAKNNILLEKDMGIDIHKNKNKSSLKEKAKNEKRKKINEANKIVEKLFFLKKIMRSKMQLILII